MSENAFLMDKNRDQFSCGRLRGRPDAWNGFVLLASCEERVAIYGWFLGSPSSLPAPTWCLFPGQQSTREPDSETESALGRDLGCCAVLSCFTCVWLLTITWIIALQAPRSMGLFRQEYWSGLPCPPPGDLPNPGIEPTSLMSPALAGRFFTSSFPEEFE